MHNSSNWQESRDFISSKWDIDILKIDQKYVLDHADELIKKDFEINWYPFFWYPVKKYIPERKDSFIEKFCSRYLRKGKLNK